MDKELIFGLDIGTRTVIGTVGYMEEKQWHILDSVCLEHEQRAMMDGQIHDIKKVANIVRNVKQKLEEAIGKKLHKVAVAAAGRVLNTQITHVEQVLDEAREITASDIYSLELLGIEKAKELLEKDKKKYAAEYFCVAHTVTHYYLDDYLLVNLEGHRGKKISADILATFLPKDVIESLYTVTERVGLEVDHLTLEPIAAMNAVIPENLRLLNLALVDIGAGTSDIALTKDGTVVAYGMIPIAGDEVTETIVHKYLVDFNTAERIKQSLNTEAVIEFEDIIGMPYCIAKEEIVDCIRPSVTELANQIAKNVVKLNGKKPPNAVFCVGGGSQMPGLTEKIAEALELPYQRVAVRNMNHVQNIQLNDKISNGPEMITPIGIGMTAYESAHKQLTQIRVNDKVVTLMNTKKLTVLDVLLEYGIEHTQIFPVNGKSLMFKLNGERCRIKGELGERAVLEREGEALALDSLVQDEDKIIFKPAKIGKDGEAKICDYIKQVWNREFVLNGETIQLPLVFVNGDSSGKLMTDREALIRDKDNIEIYPLLNIGELIKVFKLEITPEKLLVNGEEATLDTIIQGFDIVTDKVDSIESTQEVIVEEINQEVIEEPKINDGINVIINNREVHMELGKEIYLVADVFDYIDFDLTTPQGTVQLFLNGEKALVTDVITTGDCIKIFWKK